MNDFDCNNFIVNIQCKSYSPCTSPLSSYTSLFIFYFNCAPIRTQNILSAFIFIDSFNIHHLKAIIHPFCCISLKPYTPFFPFFLHSPPSILPYTLTLVLLTSSINLLVAAYRALVGGRCGGIVSALQWWLFSAWAIKLVVLSCSFLKLVCMNFLYVVFVCAGICGLDGMYF